MDHPFWRLFLYPNNIFFFFFFLAVVISLGGGWRLRWGPLSWDTVEARPC